MVSVERIPSLNVFNEIGWLILPKAFIGPKGQVQTAANPNNPVS
jgi:hypothetical protein